ncbi:MAG: hypothetical protein NZZ41_07850 [Candidatus Dojkabacteria bacterium]|nr:hypothetical protein [Candidatus Dojkabacteria bacterium]
MSDLIIDYKKFPPDFTDQLKNKVIKFIDNGMVGLSKVLQDEFKIQKMFELYLNGNSYDLIALKANVDVAIVGFLSYKYGWFNKKEEMIKELMNNVSEKMKIVKLKQLNFIADAILTIQKYYHHKIDLYELTNNEEILDETSLDWIKIYFKFLDIVSKLEPKDKEEANTTNKSLPQINIQLPLNTQIEKISDSSIAIKPIDNTEDKALEEILKTLCEIKEKQSSS